jgi:hypothetical protein
MIAGLQIGEMVMRYKSVNVLKRESDEIYKLWFWDEYEKLGRVDQLRKDLIDGDSEALAKAASPELEMARADVADLKKKYGAHAGDNLTEPSLTRLAALMRELTRRTNENKEAERRSRRFNDAWSSASPGAQWPTIH